MIKIAELTFGEEIMADVLRANALEHTQEISAGKDEETLRRNLEAEHGTGNVWTTAEMSERFTVIGFQAPFCVVTRKSDGQKGSLEFTHMPRLYYSFEEYHA